MIVMKGQDGSSKLHEPRVAYKVNSDDGGVSYVWHIQYEKKERFALNSQHLQRLLSHIYPQREKYYYTYTYHACRILGVFSRRVQRLSWL